MRKKGGMLPRLQIPLSTKLWLSNKARFLANHGKTRHPDSLMYQNMITEIIWCFEDGILQSSPACMSVIAISHGSCLSSLCLSRHSGLPMAKEDGFQWATCFDKGSIVRSTCGLKTPERPRTSPWPVLAGC